MRRRARFGAVSAALHVGAAGSAGDRGPTPQETAGNQVAWGRQTVGSPGSGRRVVAAVLPAHSDPDLVEALAGAGFDLARVEDLADLFDRPGGLLADVAVIDDDRVDPDLGVLERLRANPCAAYLPTVVVGRRLDRRVAALRQGADDFVLRPLDGEDLVERLNCIVRRSRSLRSMSPLTGLPGNVEIDATLAGLISRGTSDYAVLYADLDNFKAYNDAHGFAFGDEVLLATARLLQRCLAGHRSPLDFIGHLGGDDFVLVTDVSTADALCDDIVESFEQYAAPLPRAPHPGGLWRLLRRRAPALSLSIGVATTGHRPLASAWEISAVATEMKRVAKSTPGSCCAFDRRSGWSRMPRPDGACTEVTGTQAGRDQVGDGTG
jgi:diguanylate cyclase (GGDEF)-like protein